MAEASKPTIFQPPTREPLFSGSPKRGKGLKGSGHRASQTRQNNFIRKLAPLGIKRGLVRLGTTSYVRLVAAAARTNHLWNGTMTNPAETIRPSSAKEEGNYTETQLFYYNLELSKAFMRHVTINVKLLKY